LPAFTATEVAAVANSVYARYHREPAAEVVAQLAAIQRPDGQPAAGDALWLTLALELLNLLDADDFAEAESDSEGRPEDKLRRLVLRRCRALPPAMEQQMRQVQKKENRTRSELLREAWRHYFESRYPTVVATKAERAAINKGLIAYKRGEYITLSQLHDELATHRNKTSKKKPRKNS